MRDGDRVRRRVVRHAGATAGAGQPGRPDRPGRLAAEEMGQAEAARRHLLTPERHGGPIARARLAEADPRPFGAGLAGCRGEARIPVGPRGAPGEVYGRLG